MDPEGDGEFLFEIDVGSRPPHRGQYLLEDRWIGWRALGTGVEFEFDLPKGATSSASARHCHGVVIDLADGGAVVAKQDAGPHGFKHRHRLEGLPAYDPPQERDRLGWHLPKTTWPRQLGSVDLMVRRLTWQLYRPQPVAFVLSHPMPQRNSPLPEAEVLRVEIGGRERLHG